MANQDCFYVACGEDQQGPHHVEKILEMIHKGELAPTDYVFCEEKQDWVMMMMHSAFQNKVSTGKTSLSKKADPKTPPNITNSEDWFVLRGENKFGPFSFVELVGMLQKKTVHEFDYAWNTRMTSWARFSEIADFAPDAIRKLKDSKLPDVEEIFFRRRHSRAKYGASLLIHNNKKVWKGHGLELSEGGAGVHVDFSGLKEGEKVYLHFKPGDGVPPFNAVCEVVSKKVAGSKDKATGAQYGLKFVQIHPNVQDAIKKYTQPKAA